MKKIFLYLLILSVIGCNDNEPKKLTAPRKLSTSKKILLTKGSDNGAFLQSGVNPGDTIVIRAGLNPWSYVYLNNIKGTAKDTVVVINEGNVLMTAGIDMHNCQYVKVTGSGLGGYYGFYINQAKNGQIGGGTAINIADKSSNIKVERFKVDSCTYGMWCKNEHFCDSSLSKWVLDSIEVNNFYMGNLGQHGFYFGATEPFNKTRPSNCNGVNVYLDPSRLGNIKIHDGIIHNVGRNGVMISLASTGMSEVYNMDIDSTGNQLATDQGAGISLGGFTNAYVHHNKIQRTWLWGIVSFGGKLVRIENNTIDSSGVNPTAHQKLNWPQNIRIGVAASSNDSVTFTIRNNITGNPGKDVSSIEVYDNQWLTKSNIICDNLDRQGNPATLKTGSVVYKPCITPPVPPDTAKVVRHKGYFIENHKRIYYLMYTDYTWKEGKK